MNYEEKYAWFEAFVEKVHLKMRLSDEERTSYEKVGDELYDRGMQVLKLLPSKFPKEGFVESVKHKDGNAKIVYYTENFRYTITFPVSVYDQSDGEIEKCRHYKVMMEPCSPYNA